ncbi:unnamed protein product [Allacma fusca]|uniref:Tyrosine-protein phosphatase domain-containing protein n=1 Tax=Allacma fusca TaxID=39272 RepID=A0A8J2L9W8_9HEXA|nr:unnamed protein product [Allacma fusca]
MDQEMEIEETSFKDDTSISELSYPPLPEYPPSYWKYEMRREMQEICSNVYFGSYASATKKKLQELQEAGFTHIVCVRHVLERRVIKPNFPEHFIYKVVEMNENAIQSIIPACLSVCEFVSETLGHGGKVLIHGNGGASSSAILIIAFVMFRYGVSPKEAHQYVQQRRFCIRPTDCYLEQLKEFEPIFKAKQMGMLWKSAIPQSPMGVKRTIDDVLDSEGTVMKRSLEDGSDFDTEGTYE